MFIDDPRNVIEENEEAETEDSNFEDEEVSIIWNIEASKEKPIVHRLIDLLPVSIENLALEMAADSNIIQQLLRRLPERKALRVPRLREISYECDERCLTGMEDSCAQAGITLVQTLKYGAIKNEPLDPSDVEERQFELWCQQDDMYYFAGEEGWYDYSGY